MLEKRYTDEIAATMKKFYETLSEKDRRRYAAIEALKLGNGGQQYISEILGCDPSTVKKGAEELQKDIVADGRVRNPGGGKKKSLEQ